MKENKQAYDPGTTDIFRQIFNDAFDAGRKDGPIEEVQRLKQMEQTK